jgi:hypothetical protein
MLLTAFKVLKIFCGYSSKWLNVYKLTVIYIHGISHKLYSRAMKLWNISGNCSKGRDLGKRSHLQNEKNSVVFTVELDITSHWFDGSTITGNLYIYFKNSIHSIYVYNCIYIDIKRLNHLHWTIIDLFLLQN